ncbi:MAG: histidinol dehydrogenase [Chloroflexota bacterium]|nr:histidinol dehydrogenase [Chloroflexota bacterium]
MSAPVRVERDLARVHWSALDDDGRERWLAGLRPPEPVRDVGAIIDAVRRGGDAALRLLVSQHDRAELDELWVAEQELAEAAAATPPAILAALESAIAPVESFHAEQLALLRSARAVETRPGVRAWRRFVPLRRIAGYVPGGRAPLASSVVMLGVPARLAGVDELILATPPLPDGRVAAAVLAAAGLVGVRRVLKAGGAHAIAALAYGSESVPRVDRIFGAGGPWVTAAKRAVSADVAIDLPAGPSECVVLADRTADPGWVAADLLAQAEHGPDSVALLVTDSSAVADAVEAALAPRAATIETGPRALETLRRQGAVVLVADLEDGLAVVEAVAPEHLSLQCAGAGELARHVRSAGAVFVGPWTPVAAGDYATGTNHVLPTGGAARAWSGIGVEQFGRWLIVQEATADGVRQLAPTVEALAASEGLPAHAASVRARLERGPA